MVRAKITSNADKGVYPLKDSVRQIESALANEQIGAANSEDRKTIQRAAAQWLWHLQGLPEHE